MLPRVLSVHVFLVLLHCIFPTSAIAGASEASENPFIVAVQEISTQTTRPFSLTGTPVSSEMRVWRKYEDALGCYPDVRPCLLPAATVGDALNLLEFDWQGPANGRALDVCLFRVFSSGNPPRK